MDNADFTNSLAISYKIHKRIIDLQDRLISIIKHNPGEIQLIDSLETLIDELKAVLK